jgi:hypothetical protein
MLRAACSADAKKLNSLSLLLVVAAMAGSPDAESLQLERSMVEEELRGFLSDYIVRRSAGSPQITAP